MRPVQLTPKVRLIGAPRLSYFGDGIALSADGSTMAVIVHRSLKSMKKHLEGKGIVEEDLLGGLISGGTNQAEAS